jgi:2-phosphoglycerate kinase
MVSSVAPDRALHLARRIEDRLAANRHHSISVDEVRALARKVFGEQEGDAAAERFERWHDFQMLGRPLLLLLGGGTGVGKSTVATELARHLGITRVSSTDFIRQVLRSVVPENIAPELARSSFELDDRHGRNGGTPHAEFERQARQVLVGVHAEMERAVAEGMPLILEGIHLLPGEVDLDGVSDRGLAVHVILAVDDRHAHRHRFAARAESSARPAERYDEGLDAIRDLQEHVVSTARGFGIPVVPNQQLDMTVRGVLDVVFAAVEASTSKRQSGPAAAA